MTYGPCGGVTDDGTCEVDPLPCPFALQHVVRWDGRRPAPAAALDPLLALAGTGPVLVANAPEPALDRAALQRQAAALAPVVDAVLFGDANWARVQLPPAYRAALVAAEGVRPWAGLNCRDRNRVALEGELHALLDAGAAVHCITGDHPGLGHRPDARPVFDLDSTQLAALARDIGLLVSVAENPCTPPVAQRPARLAEKVRAGAQVAMVNHTGSVEVLARFVADLARELAGEVVSAAPLVLACVPVVGGTGSLRQLLQYPSMHLPPGFAEAVEGAADPAAEAVAQTLSYARAVVGVPGVHGLVLLGAPVPGQEAEALDATLAVAAALRAERASPRSHEPTPRASGPAGEEHR